MAVATASLLLWYPVQNLYIYHSAIGNISRTLNGAFGAASLIITGFLAIYLAIRLVVREAPRAAMAGLGAIFAFLLLALAWTVLHYLLGNGPRAGIEPFFYYSRILLSYAFLFILGVYAIPERAKKIWIFLFFVIVGNTLLNMRWEIWMIDLRQVIDPQFEGIYLGLSTTAMITGIIAWSVARPVWLRVFILASLVVLLVFAGSRANFAGILMVFPIALAFTLSVRGQTIFYSVAFLVGTLGVFLMGGMGALVGSRQLELINLSESSSQNARYEMLIQGLHQIVQNPILGYYAGQLESPRGSLGGYVHNLLSVWQTFGLLPFLFYLSLVFWGFGVGLVWFWRYRRSASREAQLISVMALLAGVLVFAAKSVGWAHIALVWGLLVGYSLRNWNFGKVPDALELKELL